MFICTNYSVILYDKEQRLHNTKAGKNRLMRQRSTMGESFGKSIHVRNFCYDVTYIRPPVQTVEVEVGKPYSLWEQNCSDNFSWLEIAW